MKRVSDRIVEEKWGNIAPLVKAETDGDANIIVIRQLWMALLRKFFFQIRALVLIV
jgi:hypothetical protein